MRLSNEGIEKARPFKPPVSKQLGIKRHNDDRFKIARPEFIDLPAPLLEIVSRMFIRGFLSCLAIVKFLLAGATSDAVIFDADKFANAARDKVDLFEREIESDVAIEIPINRVARITFLRAPNLTA